MLANKHNNITVNILRFGAHLVVEIRAIKRTFKFQCVADTQVFLDVRPHFVCCCCCKRYNGRLADTQDGGPNIAIFGAKIMSPLRNTMRLVYSIERNLHRLQKFHILIFTQRLGCYIQKLRCTTSHVVHYLLYGRLIKRRVKIMSHASVFAHAVHHVHLVFHQCDKWWYNDGCSFHQERRQLVTQALTATSWHEHKGVVTRKKIADDSLLVAFKRVETKILF